MQIFEVIPLSEFPFMETREIIQGSTVSDILNETSIERVFILIDHDTKRIWTYHGSLSLFKTQIYGGILAGKFRQQLKLFYRVYPLNMYSENDQKFKEILEKPIGVGRAKEIEKKDFPIPTQDTGILVVTGQDVKINQAMEYIDQFPHPENMIRRFMMIGGIIYNDEEFVESFLKELKIVKKPVKMGRLNNGFTFFKDQNYSTRLIIKNRKIQGIELYVYTGETSTPFELQIPLIFEEKFNKPGSIESLLSAFQIPDNLPEENEN